MASLDLWHRNCMPCLVPLALEDHLNNSPVSNLRDFFLFIINPTHDAHTHPGSTGTTTSSEAEIPHGRL